MEIKYVPYEEIDKQQWDHCISNAKHGSLYGMSFYLDAIAPEWDALITGEYEIVMPLIRRKKYGIRYLYQPAFLPGTGIFSAEAVSSETVNAFIGEVFRRFRFAEINMLYPVVFTATHKKVKLSTRNNFVVDLKRKYGAVAADYHPHFSKSLRRLQKLSLKYIASGDVKEVTDLFSSLYMNKISGLKEEEVMRFYNACILMREKQNVIVRKVYAEEKLLCAVILLKFKDRLYNMLSCVTAEGKKAEANYFLYDKIIEEFSGNNFVFDLEGSDIPGIADFYLKMSPVNEPDQFIRYNDLPLPFRFFKK